MIYSIIKQVRRSLKNASEERHRISGQRFFKETVKLYGVPSAQVKKIAKEHFVSIKEKPKVEIFDLCEELWQSDYIEETFIACDWSYYIHKDYDAGDFTIFERWVETHVDNWASCDTLCNHSVGTLVEMYPKLVSKLKNWAKSENRWTKRSAAVSLIIPARKGLFRKEIFQIAKTLLHDEDDLVQKGYGWMLKAAADFDRNGVFEFVMKHKKTMPRTALRYAIEKMPPEMRKKAMEKQP